MTVTVDVQTAEERRALAEEGRRRLGRVYAFLLSLPDAKAAEGDRAGEHAPSAAGSVATRKGGDARKV